jgi:TatA/E family protein of Tat protein translocase
MHTLLILETIGTTELLLILVVALILFGPRKLPELARQLGRGMNEFKRASDDFKRTWEREVEVERIEQQGQVERAMVGAPDAPEASAPAPTVPPLEGEQIARGSARAPLVAPTDEPEPPPPLEPAGKSEWL